MKSRFLRKFVSIAIALCLMFCCGISVSAANVEKESLNASSTYETRAVSGTGVITVNGTGSFSIYSPDWSLFAHAVIYISGASGSNWVTVTITDPNGRAVIPTQSQIFTSSGTFYQNFYNAPAGYYTVTVTTQSDTATVSVSLGDMYV